MTKNLKIGFIGGGHMTTAIITGLRRGGWPGRLTVIDRNEHKLQQLRVQFDAVGMTAIKHLPADLDIIMLAVKPTNILEACRQINVTGALIVSLAPGFSCSQIAAGLTFSTERIMRALPNTPAACQHGITPLYTPAGAQRSDIQALEDIFSIIGAYGWLPNEKLVDVSAVVSGAGPGYIYYFTEVLLETSALQDSNGGGRDYIGERIQTLGCGLINQPGEAASVSASESLWYYDSFVDAFLAAAVDLGLNSAQARWLIGNTLHGAGTMITQSTQSIVNLRQAVAVSGGITEAGLAVMAAAGLKELIRLHSRPEKAPATTKVDAVFSEKLALTVKNTLNTSFQHLAHLSAN